MERSFRETFGAGVSEVGGRTRRVLDLVANKWSVLVIYALSEGTKRHNRLHREVEGVSQKMLVNTLRGLERDGLVARRVYPEVPPRVEYSLTPLGESLVVPLSALYSWAEGRIGEVEAARRRYDGQRAGDNQ